VIKLRKRRLNMATKTTRLSIDMNPKDHRKLKILADTNGLSLKDFMLIVLEPYLHPSRAPNKKTQKAIENVEKRTNIKSFKDVSHMWKELGLDE
jgi:hypothetical protein